MKDLVKFEFKSHEVRTVIIDGEPWFVAKDVCEILEIANARDAVAALDSDEKDGVGITDAIGREQKTTVVSESGLYALIFKSRKPQAKAFRKWVTSEVLPQIRKTGKYEVQKTPQTYIEALEALVIAEKEKQKLIDDRYLLIPWIESLREYRGFTELTRKMLVAMVEDIFVFEGGKVRVTFRYADQIADLMRMSLKEGEEIKVPRKMEIFVDDEIVTPVMPNPTPPPILPLWLPDRIDDNGVEFVIAPDRGSLVAAR